MHRQPGRWALTRQPGVAGWEFAGIAGSGKPDARQRPSIDFGRRRLFHLRAAGPGHGRTEYSGLQRGRPALAAYPRVSGPPATAWGVWAEATQMGHRARGRHRRTTRDVGTPGLVRPGDYPGQLTN